MVGGCGGDGRYLEQEVIKGSRSVLLRVSTVRGTGCFVCYVGDVCSWYWCACCTRAREVKEGKQGTASRGRQASTAQGNVRISRREIASSRTQSRACCVEAVIATVRLISFKDSAVS